MFDINSIASMTDERKVQTMHEAQQTIQMYERWKASVQKDDCPIVFKLDTHYNGPKLMHSDHRKMAIMMITVELDEIIANAKEMRRAIAETFI